MVSPEEYACEMAAHYASFPGSNGVINNAQERMIAKEVFHVADSDQMHYPEQKYESKVSFKDTIAVSLVTHIVFLSWFLGSGFKYTGVYFIGLVLGLIKEFYYPDQSKNGVDTSINKLNFLFKYLVIIITFLRQLLILPIVLFFLNFHWEPGVKYFSNNSKEFKDGDIELHFISPQDEPVFIDQVENGTNTVIITNSFKLKEDQIGFTGKVSYQYQPDQRKQFYTVLSMASEYYGSRISAAEIEHVYVKGTLPDRDYLEPGSVNHFNNANQRIMKGFHLRYTYQTGPFRGGLMIFMIL